MRYVDLPVLEITKTDIWVFVKGTHIKNTSYMYENT
jgi:hypothetical protein